MKRAPTVSVALTVLLILPFTASASDATDATPEAPPEAASATRDGGFAIELGTGGLSGPLGGALGLGWAGAGSRLSGGLAFDFRHASLTGPEQGSSTAELTETALALGPWLRFETFRTADGRVSLIGAIDLLYAAQVTTAKVDTNPDREEGSANGIIFRAGPGIRFWATPWLALGYTTQLSLRYQTGPGTAFPRSTVLGPADYEFSDFELALVGRFTALAVF